MSSIALAGVLRTGVLGPSWAPTLLAVLLAGGLVGMSIRTVFESIMSEDDGADGEAAESTADSGAGDGGLMAEAPDDGGDDDLGGLGGLDGDDDLGEFDEGSLGEEDGGGGGSVDELEHRLDELETEFDSLSSTVSTVRSENEQISESVGEVEENVRKLLDIYEMVTRGVNPFADDLDAGMGAGGAAEEGNFGLFSDGDLGEPEAEEIDEDDAAADAEGFFEDDLEEEPEGPPLGDDSPEPGGETAETTDDFSEFEDFEEDPVDPGGTSFEDLKEEYEGESEGEDVAAAAEPDDEVLEEDLTEAESPAAGVEDAVEDAADDAVAGGAAATAGEAGGDSQTDAAATAGTQDAATTDAGARDQPAHGDGKPYLATLPEGYAADLLVVEWLEYLVDQAGVRGTARAIDYYESIDWITPAVADDLEDYLSGFQGGGDGSLTIDHHTKSLEYVSDLNGGTDALAVDRLAHGGGPDGIQR